MSSKVAGLGKLQRGAIGSMVGIGLNTGIHFLIHDGKFVEPVFDSNKALLALGAELALSMAVGVISRSPVAAVVSGATSLALFGLDMATPRSPVVPMPKPGSPATALSPAKPGSSQAAALIQASASPISSFFSALFAPSKPAALAPTPVAARPGTSTPATSPSGGFITSYDQLQDKPAPQASTPTFVTSYEELDPSFPITDSGELMTDYEGMAGARRFGRTRGTLGSTPGNQPSHMKVGNGHTWRPGKITTDADAQTFNTYARKYPKPVIPSRY